VPNLATSKASQCRRGTLTICPVRICSRAFTARWGTWGRSWHYCKGRTLSSDCVPIPATEVSRICCETPGCTSVSAPVASISASRAVSVIWRGGAVVISSPVVALVAARAVIKTSPVIIVGPVARSRTFVVVIRHPVIVLVLRRVSVCNCGWWWRCCGEWEGNIIVCIFMVREVDHRFD
jgi:hypothetical protein